MMDFGQQSALAPSETLSGTTNGLPNNTPIDPRTGFMAGQMTEDEVLQSFAETEAIHAVTDAPRHRISPVKNAIISGIDGPVDIAGGLKDTAIGFKDAVNTQQKVLQDTIGIIKDSSKVSYLQAKMNSKWAEHNETQSEESALNALEIQKEIEGLKSDLPEDYNKIAGFLAETAGEIGGQLWDRIETTPTRQAEHFQAQDSLTEWGVKAGPAGAELKYNVKLSIGEITGSLYGLEGVDPDIKKQVAQDFGIAMGSIDQLSEAITTGLGAVAGAAKNKGLAEALEFIGGVVAEGGTESTQEIIGNVARIYAKNVQAERDGTEKTPYTFETVTENALTSGAKGMLGGTMMSSGGAVVGGSLKYSSEAIQTLRDKRVRDDNAAKAEQIIEQEKGDKLQQMEISEDSTVPYMDEEGQVERVSPIKPIEVTEQHLNDSYNSRLDDGAFSDDRMTEAGKLLDEMNTEYSETEQSFESTLREILPDPAHADAVMAVLEGAARAFGGTVEQYLQQTGLRLQDMTGVDKRDGKGRQVKGEIELGVVNEVTKRAENIIRAYNASDVSTLVHELGHHFRQFVPQELLKTIEGELGVIGGKWTPQAEERFARGFEHYLATGKAPTPKLEAAFMGFKKWMTDIYKSIRGTSIDIPVSPEMKAIFDEMIAGEGQARFDISDTNMEAKKLQQVAEEGKNTPMDKGKMTERKRDQFELFQGLEEMHKWLIADEKILYQGARAELKAKMARQRKRSKTQKQHTSGKKRIIKTLKKNLPSGRKRKVSKMDKSSQDSIIGLTEAYTSIGTMKAAKQYLKDVHEGKIPLKDDPYQREKVDFAMASLNRTKRGIGQLKQIESQVKSLVELGKAQSYNTQLNALADSIVNENTADYLGTTESLDSVKKRMRDNNPKEVAKERNKNKKLFKERLAGNTLGKKWIHGLDGLLKMASTYSSKEMGQSVLSKMLNFFDNRQEMMTEIRQEVDALNAKMDELYGFKGAEAKKAWQRNSKRNLYRKKDIDIGLDLPIDINQIQDYWMKMQNEGAREILRGQGIDDKVGGVINKWMVAHPEEHQMAQYLLDRYKDMHASISEVHERTTGAALDMEENYSPLRAREVAQIDYENRNEIPTQADQDRGLRSTPDSTGRVKIRNNSVKQTLDIRGAMSTFEGYVEEMAHYKAFTEKVHLARKVFTNKDFKTMMDFEHPGLMTALNNAIEDIGANGANMAHKQAFLDNLRSGSVVINLALNPTVYAKQLISVVNYWTEMPGTAYLKFLGNFATGQSWRDLKTVWSSDYAKNRNIDRDIKEFQGSTEYERFRINPSIKNWSMLGVKWGDRMAIAFGGGAYYRHLLENGKDGVKMTEAEAIREVGMQSEKTQQSGNLEQLSTIQRGSSGDKLMTTYSTGPVQGQRQLNEAVAGFMNGRIGLNKAAKTLFVHQFIVPAMYSGVASFMSADEGELMQEDWEKEMMYAMLMGQWGNIYSLFRVVANQGKALFGLDPYRSSDIFTDLAGAVLKVPAMIRDQEMEEITIQEVAEAAEAISVGFGKPLPVGAAIEFIPKSVKIAKKLTSTY